MATSLLAACALSPDHKVRYSSNRKGTDITAGIVQREGVSDRRAKALRLKLQKSGLDIISVGQDYRIIIPIQKLFYNTSPRILDKAYGTLNEVIAYLQQFRKVTVRVSAYSSDKDAARAGALSLARARTVADYLWTQAIDARLVYTQAHSIELRQGCCKDDNYKLGEDSRSHLEIIFRNRIV